MAWRRFCRLHPVVYSYKGNDDQPDGPSLRSDPPDKLFVGLIAQEAEDVLPGIVSRRDGVIDGIPVDDLRTIDPFRSFIYALINAV